MTTCNNNYALETAATGAGTVLVANPLLNGTNTVPIFQAGENGAVIRSVIIKAIAPTTTGMVRLFIFKTPAIIDPLPPMLYKEVMIPIQPEAAAVPVPTSMYTMFETTLIGGLRLQAMDTIVASTQNAEPFNIIVEAANWAYPKTPPTDCCNFRQEVANTGQALISTANPFLNGSGTIVPIYTADGSANGSVVKAITIKAMQSTHEGVVRIFIIKGNVPKLMREVWIPQTTQSSYDPSFKQVLEMDYYLQPGVSLAASTQNEESFSITVDAIDWNYAI